MKTIDQLEQEAKQAREVAQDEFIDNFVFSEESSRKLVDKLIEASVAMVTYQFALGMQEVSGDGSGEALPEAHQEERDSDGWVEWNGGDCPVQSFEKVEVMFKGQTIENKIDFAGKLSWQHHSNPWPVFSRNIIAYRISK
ncbi:hypothetical protein [Undibacterium baiyunense]|uniref:Uncharacterized protein n=1 Tax=Undibacterium baiyunense TaxID=2828731 RepID=A0A941I2F7_9BURK|nr:hypothetical protein [Undibacterium baiyunense]MBR7747443.1 hypothetical protein [Undibacterium baiyunense]